MDQPLRQLELDRDSSAAESQFPTTVILRLMAVDIVAVRTEQQTKLQVDCSLPGVQTTVRLAEVIHRALIRKAAKGQRIECPELTGQNSWGQPLIGAHRHAHVLPVDIDGDDQLDHVVIHSPMGLRPLALEALGELKTLFDAQGQPWLRLQPVVSPLLDRWLCVHTPRALGLSSTSRAQTEAGELRSQPGGAVEWISLTPFVPPRYLKKSGKNALAGQVNAELQSRNHPPAEVTELDWISPQHFDYHRHTDHVQPPQRVAYLLRLKFRQPIFGPISLGYASHFGLGLFRALG